MSVLFVVLGSFFIGISVAALSDRSPIVSATLSALVFIGVFCISLGVSMTWVK